MTFSFPKGKRHWLRARFSVDLVHGLCSDRSQQFRRCIIMHRQSDRKCTARPVFSVDDFMASEFVEVCALHVTRAQSETELAAGYPRRGARGHRPLRNIVGGGAANEKFMKMQIRCSPWRIPTTNARSRRQRTARSIASNFYMIYLHSRTM